MLCDAPANTNPYAEPSPNVPVFAIEIPAAKISWSRHPLVCIALCVVLAFMRATENIVRFIGGMNRMITQLPHGL